MPSELTVAAGPFSNFHPPNQGSSRVQEPADTRRNGLKSKARSRASKRQASRSLSRMDTGKMHVSISRGGVFLNLPTDPSPTHTNPPLSSPTSSKSHGRGRPRVVAAQGAAETAKADGAGSFFRRIQPI
jgi:hypothetical protein